jgi:epoxyqueuosine reductase
LELLPLLKMTESEFKEKFRNSPIRRAQWTGMLRNVCVALGNIGDPRTVPALLEALHHDEPLVRGHAAWALGRLDGPEATGTLEQALAAENDESVREEFAAVLNLSAER